MLTSMSALRQLGLLAAIALLVVACGGQAATPTAAPTPAPTPTPSPTPIDVGALVLKTIQASDYSASFKLAGTGTYGGQALTSTGTWDTAGGNSHTSTHYVLGSESWTADSIEVGGKSWDSNADGPYIPSANTKCAGMTDALGLVKTLTDAGTVTKNGQTVHHLTIDGGVDASCTASTSTSVTDMKVTVELFATDDGKLVAIDETESWTQFSGGSPISASMTAEATPTGQPAAAIVAPTAPWSVYEDAAGHFRVAYPAGWTEELFQGRPSLRDPGHNYIVQLLVTTLPAGYTLADYAKADRDSLNVLKSLKVNATQKADLGGEAGGLLQFHYSSGGQTLHGLDVYTVHSGNSYDVFWVSMAGTEKADVAMFTNIVNSFAFTL